MRILVFSHYYSPEGNAPAARISAMCSRWASLGHRVTRETCSCPAGQHDVPCKHRALVIAHLDIRVPEVARQWARRRRRRERAMAEAA